MNAWVLRQRPSETAGPRRAPRCSGQRSRSATPGRRRCEQSEPVAPAVATIARAGGKGACDRNPRRSRTTVLRAPPDPLTTHAARSETRGRRADCRCRPTAARNRSPRSLRRQLGPRVASNRAVQHSADVLGEKRDVLSSARLVELAEERRDAEGERRAVEHLLLRARARRADEGREGAAPTHLAELRACEDCEGEREQREPLACDEDLQLGRTEPRRCRVGGCCDRHSAAPPAPPSERGDRRAERRAVARNRPESRFAVAERAPRGAAATAQSRSGQPSRSLGPQSLKGVGGAEYSFGSFSGKMGGGSSCDASRSSAPCASPSRGRVRAHEEVELSRDHAREHESSPRSPQPRHWWSRLNILAPTSLAPAHHTTRQCPRRTSRVSLLSRREARAAAGRRHFPRCQRRRVGGRSVRRAIGSESRAAEPSS